MCLSVGEVGACVWLFCTASNGDFPFFCLFDALRLALNVFCMRCIRFAHQPFQIARLTQKSESNPCHSLLFGKKKRQMDRCSLWSLCC